ncbi:sigma-54-dependent Fis family transcriptional regulator [Acinetobacter seifertii]|uniref:Sigma-54-dependent Fis family transcriptional regulator n=1 Tax=Acinetobacter seifertii TaxID=1530123 RepID=A0A5E9PEJ5_9GAMM|nr:sigma 54-interacting transcriptional regulator [Acinetobacter seifertii]MBJ8505741.1 sigma-54-dependent Fis family transcriptional regulator [Acinetobacter seifertii]TEU27012.1 sigma-54-dependent Fis family transcriptional regulator [Acinetobacter seifertii]
MQLTNNAWKDIKHNFYQDGTLPNSFDENFPFIQAWKIAKASGLDPDTKLSSLNNIDSHRLKKHEQMLAEFVFPVVQDIWKLFSQQDICVFFINENYKIIAEKHDEYDSQSYCFLQQGQIVEPSRFGAIAPTCSVLSKKPVIMTGHEHYLNIFSEYSCASVPVFNGEGKILGAIDITSKQKLLASNWYRHLLYQSHVLENNYIRAKCKADEKIIAFQHSKDLLDTAYVGLITINQWGQIIKANQMALKLLNIEFEKIYKNSLSDFFIIQQTFQDILDQKEFLIQSKDNAYFYASFSEKKVDYQSLESQSLTKNQQVNTAVKALLSNIPVLITGETGTGKDYIARQIHEQISSKIPLISINCGAIPENLIEAELFGYEEGAYTGAKNKGQKGLIELAHDGILFLDEIGEMPLHLQVKLLRVLQDQIFYKVGGRTPIKSNFKLICATNQNLEQLIEAKLFRNDLYYRLRGFEIELKPLKERSDKLKVFYQILNSNNIEHWDLSIENAFNNYHWPGNIRELINVVRVSKLYMQNQKLEQLVLPKNPPVGKQEQQLDDIIKEQIQHALNEENGNISKVAKRLKISRTTIYKYLNRSD